MGNFTYKNLFNLVDEQIDKRVVYRMYDRYGNQLGRTSVSPFMMSSSGSRMDVSSAELIQTIHTMLGEALAPRIIDGLSVTASDTVGEVTVSAGSGSIAGYVYTLSSDIDLVVPFDDLTKVFYVNLYKSTLYIDKKEDSKKLKIAKIVVPKPGTTDRVKDNKNDDFPWDAYIINYKEYKLYGDANGNFEENTIDLLRDNISPILADNLIGNIRLTEDLKIINTAGTLVLDSNSMELKDTSENVMAKFNRNGTFFYDTNGIEMARFTVDDARVGNILILKDRIRSGNYASEVSGFEIRDDGYAEFDNVRVRGRISSSVFEYDKISAVGGKLYVANSSILASDMTALDSTTITAEDSLFTLNEVLRMKDGTDDEYLLVTDITNAPIYTVTRDLAEQYDADDNPTWTTGTAIVSTGQASSGAGVGGYISLDSVSAYSPFIDIVYRDSDVYNDVTLKARLGNLEGIVDSDFGGTLNDFGLYTVNAYLKGCLHSSTICSSTIIGNCIQTSSSGKRVELTDSGLFEYDSNGCLLTKLVGEGLCLIDPECSDCYSYLSSGALRFNHPYGTIPYVKRIESGVATTGETVCLCQWYETPKIIIGVNTLKSYDSGYSSSCQEWCVYYDDLEQYTTSGDETNFGYKFDVHSKLTVSGGTESECVHNDNFDVTNSTNANVCSSIVKLRYQLWCHGAAPSNWCYACICYDVCYRLDESGPPTWCCCQYTYVQAHSLIAEMCCTCTICNTITFGTSGTWQMAIHETELTWHDSGLASGTVECCHVTCCADNITIKAMICASQPPYSEYCYYSSAFGSAPADDEYIFCNCLCITICKMSVCAQGNASNRIGYATIKKRYAPDVWSYQAVSTCSCMVCCSFETCLIAVTNTNCYCTQYDIEASAIATGPVGAGVVTAVSSGCCTNINTIRQCVCYCVFSGAADDCCYRNFYSTIDTTSGETILDNSGTINWLAIAYS